MKKRVIAIGALALAAGTAGAQAQSALQLTGLVDLYVGSSRNAGDAGRTTTVNSGGMTTSWVGVKGSEDLGGGLKANFALTSFIRANTGEFGRFAGDTFLSRDANVGLAGGFGAVTVGRALAPNFLPTVIFNPFGDSFAFSPLVLHANVPLFNATQWGATSPSDTGWSNEIVYSTPDWGGLSGNVHYQLGQQPDQGGVHNVGANFLYFHGPFAAGGFYEEDQLTNPVPAVFATGDKKTDWMLAGSYDFKLAKAYASYGKAKSSTLAPRARTVSLGASVPTGAAGAVLAGIARTEVTPGNTRTTTTVGYDHNLSKRTDLYAMLMQDRITSFASGTSWGVGVRHRF